MKSSICFNLVLRSFLSKNLHIPDNENLMYPYRVNDITPNLAFAIKGEISGIILEQIPELKQDFPNTSNSLCSTRLCDNILIVLFELPDRSTTVVGEIPLDVAQRIVDLIGKNRRYADINSIPTLASYFDWNKVLLIGDPVDGSFDWDLMREDIIAWLNDKPLPRAVSINEKRVRSALPDPPRYSLEQVQRALWVLESDNNMSQGTAFDLEGYGTITNYHVVEGTTDTCAFRPHFPGQRYPIKILRFHKVIDLAVIEIVGNPTGMNLHPAGIEKVKQMDHVAVCGFPNFNIGDTGILSPGLVVGFRRRSGVRRMLTNAGIVAGMSGGPAIGADNKVLGVCVTGADYIQGGRDTEDQSIIPIDALDLL